MNKNNLDIVTGRKKRLQKFINIFPKSFRLKLNPRRYSIEKFVEEQAKKTKTGYRILDAGAGPCPYKPMFSHCKYEATDFEDNYKMLDFTCSLDKIPKKDNSYDSIICTEVLEHVENPEKVIKEFYRILKRKGKLVLTTPQQFMMHQKPHNYYYFTYFGLKNLIEKAGFSTYIIKPMGGYFWALGDMVRHNNLSKQYKNNFFVYYLLRFLAYPLTQIIFPFILFHLDSIDKDKDWTMGYLIEAIK